LFALGAIFFCVLIIAGEYCTLAENGLCIFWVGFSGATNLKSAEGLLSSQLQASSKVARMSELQANIAKTQQELQELQASQ